MNTPPGDRLRIADLAHGPVLQRTIPAAKLDRLAQASQLREAVQAQLEVHQDQRGRYWLTGTAQTTVALDCHRCMEPLPQALSAGFKLWLVDEQRLANLERTDAVMLAQADIRLITDGVIDVAQLVEDELLLELDMQPCKDAQCPNMPVLRYGDEPTERLDSDDDSEQSPQADRQRPFAQLQQMLQGKEAESD